MKHIEQTIPISRTGKHGLDAALIEIAWHKALKSAQEQGFTHVVSVTSVPADSFQLHYYTSLERANEFYEMTKTKPEYWKNALPPITVKQALKQCWS